MEGQHGREAGHAALGDRLGPGELAQAVLAVDAAEAGVADAAEGQRGQPAKERAELTEVMPVRSRRAIAMPVRAWRRPPAQPVGGGVGQRDRLVDAWPPW